MSNADKSTVINELAVRHRTALHRFLASRLRNALTEVPDLVQEVFLRLLRVDRLDTVRSPEAYLFGIARHVLHQHRSQTAALPETVDIADVLAELGDLPASGPEAKIEMQQRIESFHRALSQLPPNVYATLILNRVVGLTLEEVAARLGVSRGMTKKYLATALERCLQRDREAE
ncbi:RNA polymerase sigma factor [Steroidobacter sp.]|uniref:RNA polymerase sigma factor n=1 Tax=Steroidobacter sp. TaxID=1978227 RepID=UPI0025EB06ED|nr:sigma-70 family RNA polymerase sigma factor [Steroidobacter sp.]